MGVEQLVVEMEREEDVDRGVMTAIPLIAIHTRNAQPVHRTDHPFNGDEKPALQFARLHIFHCRVQEFNIELANP